MTHPKQKVGAELSSSKLLQSEGYLLRNGALAQEDLFGMVKAAQPHLGQLVWAVNAVTIEN